MFKELYDNNAIFLFLGLICVTGIIFEIIAKIGHNKMVKAAKNIANTEDKFILHIKNIYEEKWKNNENVNNVDSFVDKYVYNYKFCGLKLSTVNQICGQIKTIVTILAVIISVLAIYNDCGQQVVLSTILFGIVVVGLLGIIRKNVDNSYICRETKIYIVDYLENTLKLRCTNEVKRNNSESIISKLNKYIGVECDENNMTNNKKNNDNLNNMKNKKKSMEFESLNVKFDAGINNKNIDSKDNSINGENTVSVKDKIKTSQKNVDNVKEEIEVSEENVDSVKEEIKVSEENVDSVKEEIKISEENVDSVKEEIKISEENVDNFKDEIKDVIFRSKESTNNKIKSVSKTNLENNEENLIINEILKEFLT